MNTKEVKRLVESRPFQALTINMSGGQIYQVERPEEGVIHEPTNVLALVEESTDDSDMHPLRVMIAIEHIQSIDIHPTVQGA